MAIFNGTQFGLYTVGSPGNKKIANVTSNGLTINSEPIDITTKDSAGWKETMVGLRSWGMSVEGIIDFQANTSTEEGAVELLTMQLNREMVELVATNLTSGDLSFTGHGVITNVEISAPMEDKVTFTCDIEGSGPITMAEIA